MNVINDFNITKNINYIRNVQEIKILKEKYNEVKIIYSKSKNYLIRILIVNLKMLILNKKYFDIIFIGFLPQLILPFLYNKKNKKQIIVIDFFISLYDTLVNDRKKVKQNSIISKILKKIDEKTLEKADKIIVDTKESAKYYEKEFNAPSSKVKVLYIKANDEIYSPYVKPIEKESEKDFVVLYFGTILPLQGIDIILKKDEYITFDIDNKIVKLIDYKLDKYNINYLILDNLEIIKIINYTNNKYLEIKMRVELLSILLIVSKIYQKHLDIKHLL